MTKHRLLDFSDVCLYGVSPSEMASPAFLEKVEQMLAGGVDALQLRLKNLTDREFLELAREVKKRCERADALLIINNRVDLALAVSADGVHVGQDDLSVSFARELLGHRKIIGASTHSVPQALAAQREGADYVSCGPLWATPTKPTYPAIGLQSLALYRAALKVPIVAIGGIDEKNIDQVVAAGARTVAVVRGLFEASDPKAAAENFKEKIEAGRIEVLA